MLLPRTLSSAIIRPFPRQLLRECGLCHNGLHQIPLRRFHQRVGSIAVIDATMVSMTLRQY